MRVTVLSEAGSLGVAAAAATATALATLAVAGPELRPTIADAFVCQIGSIAAGDHECASASLQRVQWEQPTPGAAEARPVLRRRILDQMANLNRYWEHWGPDLAPEIGTSGDYADFVARDDFLPSIEMGVVPRPDGDRELAAALFALAHRYARSSLPRLSDSEIREEVLRSDCAAGAFARWAVSHGRLAPEVVPLMREEIARLPPTETEPAGPQRLARFNAGYRSDQATPNPRGACSTTRYIS